MSRGPLAPSDKPRLAEPGSGSVARSIDRRLKRQAGWIRVLKELCPRRWAAAPRLAALKERIQELRQRREARAHWAARTQMVLACPDNAFIPRVPGAGMVREGRQTLHNGLVVAEGSYYGPLMTRLLQANGGVHEPQEERVFQEVLPFLPSKATMVELGSYWAFYSLWFHLRVKGARSLLIEPDWAGLLAGQLNFALNGREGRFINAFVGERARRRAFGTPTISLDSLVATHSLDRIHLLHCDIQGHEVAMLRGARGILERRQVDYLFISTHTDDLHRQCLDLVRAYHLTVVAEHNVAESFSYDGLIAARRTEMPGLEHVAVSRRSSTTGR